MSVAEERLTSRKQSINLMPKSMNEVCVCVCVCVSVCVCVGSCGLLHASVLGTCLRAWMHVFRISSPVQLFKHIQHCAVKAVELPIGPCSAKVEQHTGALVGLHRLISFLLCAARDGMHRRRDQVSFFPVLMDQRTCLGFCIRFAGPLIKM